MTLDELIDRHRLQQGQQDGEQLRMAKAIAPLRSKHYQAVERRIQHFRPPPSKTRKPWLYPEDTSEADRPLGSGNAASTRFTDIVRAAATDILRHGAALGGDPQIDAERWLNEYLDAHHGLQADFLCEIYARAIRAIVHEKSNL